MYAPSFVTSYVISGYRSFQGVCEFPHNVMHRRVFMAFFVVYHILIVGFVVNFCYVVLVLVSPKCRYE